MQSALITVFKRWGIPQWMKTDNGRPLGDPQRQIVPVLALWLIGLGIRLIWNRPRIPQDNAKVERFQGVLANWVEWKKCANPVQLQDRLWREATFHNFHYPVSRLGRKTRIEAFPDLRYSNRPYDPKQFNVQRVLDFLAKGHWKRSANKNGQITFWGKRMGVGSKYKYQQISIKMEAATNHWMLFDPQGRLIKKVPTRITAKKIWELDLS